MIEISDLLAICVERNASDIHLAVGRAPSLRDNGILDPIGDEVLKPEDTERLMKSITSDDYQQKINEQGGVDFGFAFGDVARFRVSVFRQKGVYGMVLRLIPSKLLTFEEIGLNPSIKELLHRPRGLVMVTGPTGCGKTTTLASMIDYINLNRDCHIVTIEDPIEYYHEHKRGIINQRELHVDVPSFSEAIVKALRMDPDVILVGEMRDLATIEAAVMAAETGHLVLATLHTTSAAQTVDRIIQVFPVDQQDQIRTQLSTSIVAIICQQLLVKPGGGRIAAFEVMVSTPSIQNLIRDKKTFRITSDIQTGAKYGMQTLDTSLFAHYANGLISYDDTMARCFDPEAMHQKIEGLSSGKKK